MQLEECTLITDMPAHRINSHTSLKGQDVKGVECDSTYVSGVEWTVFVEALLAQFICYNLYCWIIQWVLGK
jgi:hypothetical protein